jgi:hypothetical protein
MFSSTMSYGKIVVIEIWAMEKLLRAFFLWKSYNLSCWNNYETYPFSFIYIKILLNISLFPPIWKKEKPKAASKSTVEIILHENNYFWKKKLL